MQRSNIINHTQMVTIHYTTSLIKHKKLKVAKIPSLTLYTPKKPIAFSTRSVVFPSI